MEHGGRHFGSVDVWNIEIDDLSFPMTLKFAHLLPSPDTVRAFRISVMIEPLYFREGAERTNRNRVPILLRR